MKDITDRLLDRINRILINYNDYLSDSIENLEYEYESGSIDAETMKILLDEDEQKKKEFYDFYNNIGLKMVVPVYSDPYFRGTVGPEELMKIAEFIDENIEFAHYDKEYHELINLYKGIEIFRSPILFEMFNDYMKMIEFEVVYNRPDRTFSLKDCTGANLGNIEEERFESLNELLERLDNYHKDYVVNDLYEKIDECLTLAEKEKLGDAKVICWDELSEKIESVPNIKKKLFDDINWLYFISHTYPEFDDIELCLRHVEIEHVNETVQKMIEDGRYDDEYSLGELYDLADELGETVDMSTLEAKMNIGKEIASQTNTNRQDESDVVKKKKNKDVEL